MESWGNSFNSLVPGTLRVSDAADPDNWVMYLVVEIINATGYNKISLGGQLYQAGTLTAGNVLLEFDSNSPFVAYATGDDPHDTYPSLGPGFLWDDVTTSPGTLKMRNDTDDGWVTINPDFSGCYAYDDSEGLSLADDTNTAIAFNQERYDTDNYHDNATQNTRFTVPVTGKYRIGGGLTYPDPGADFMISVACRINGSGALFGRNSDRGEITPSVSGFISFSVDLDLTAGQYIEIMGYKIETGAGTLALTTAYGTISLISSGPPGDTSITYTKLTGSLSSTTTTTLGDVTGLSFAVLSGVYYKFRFDIVYRAAATTTGLKVSVTIPAATIFSAFADTPVSTAADGTANIFRGWITSSDDPVIGTGTPAIATDYIATIEGVLLPSANGTLQARYASEVSGSSVTVRQASIGELQRLP